MKLIIITKGGSVAKLNCSGKGICPLSFDEIKMYVREYHLCWFEI